MITPVQQDSTFLNDVIASRTLAGQLHIWWLGQSGFLVQWQGRYLLFDPYLSDSLTTKYASTDKPHVRMTERVIAPEHLNFIDVVTSSHNHTDHLDAETLTPLMAVNREMTLVVPAANQNFAAQRLGVDQGRLMPIDVSSSVDVHGFRLTGVPAAHEELARDDQGRYHFLGLIVECGPWTIYHSSDTILYPGMIETLRQWQVDVAILPINGSRPERRVAGNLDGAEAAMLAQEIGAQIAIPCHYEMFEFNTAPPDLFIKRCEATGQSYRVLRAGERWSSSPAG